MWEMVIFGGGWSESLGILVSISIFMFCWEGILLDLSSLI